MAINDKVPELTNNGFNDFIKEGLVLIDFFADWCMPCIMMGPVFDEVSDKFKGKIKFGKVSVGDNQALAQKFKVVSIPNLILFKDGNQIDQFIGGLSSEEIEAKLNKHLQ